MVLTDLITIVFRANQGVSYSKRTTVCWNDSAVSRCKGAALWRRRSGARDIKAARLVCILRVSVTFIESRLRSTIPRKRFGPKADRCSIPAVTAHTEEVVVLTETQKRRPVRKERRNWNN
ncbi:hypothetical protein J6590_086940 [Homalodisca vitripennis]|nr:hypothetical protein J6590_086940 [Homalodisca vitripennis]